MNKFKSKVDKLLDRLRKEGKITELSDEQVMAIDAHIRKDMEEFRAEMYRRESRNWPYRPIILSA